MEPDRNTCGCAQTCTDFWAPDPPVPHPIRDALGAAPRPFLAAAIAFLLAVAMPAHAAAAPPFPPMDGDQDLDSLRAEAEQLGEEYNGELVDMEAIIQKAEEAAARAESTQEDVEAAQEQVQQLAVASYQADGLDPALSIFLEENPQDVIDRSVVVGFLSHTNHEQISQLEGAIERDRVAQANAEEQAEEFEDDLQELKERREEVQALIGNYPDQPQGGRYNLTPRTEQMRELFIEEFGEGPQVGCYRPHDGGAIFGEHPLGRACDFMLSMNGQMPPEDEIQRGWDISEYAQERAEELGVMYIIYRQQIWDVRRGDTDWRPMSDRGNITENHFDHVHISMF